MKTKDIFFYALGSLIVIGFFSILIVLIWKGGADYKDTIQLIVGALIGAFLTVVGYFYGTSKSSASKDETISKALNKTNE